MTRHASLLTLLTLLTLLLLPAAPPARAQGAPATHRLVPSPSTVAWGFYDAAAAPVLRVRSGDEIQVGTLITSSPQRLEGAGVAPADVEPALRAIYAKVTDK